MNQYKPKAKGLKDFDKSDKDKATTKFNSIISKSNRSKGLSIEEIHELNKKL